MTIFTKILDGEIPADKVYEDKHTLAFLDIQPVHKGHTLVIPKTPVKDIFELPEEEAGHLMNAISKVANAVRAATKAPAVNVISNNGAEAGQVVFHLHFHIIPRFNNKEFEPLPHVPYETDEEKVQYARNIAQHTQ